MGIIYQSLGIGLFIFEKIRDRLFLLSTAPSLCSVILKPLLHSLLHFYVVQYLLWETLVPISCIFWMCKTTGSIFLKPVDLNLCFA